MSTVFDLSERVEVTSALEVRNRRFRDARAVASVAVWELSAPSGRLHRVAGLDPLFEDDPPQTMDALLRPDMDSATNVRALLHHQVSELRNRSGALRCPRDYPVTRRGDPCHQHAGAGL